MRNTIKKGLTIAVSVMTAVWSVGISAFAPIAASAVSVAAEGDLVKASLPAVYYIGDNGKRYVFPNQKTYNTWYSDFSSVDTISDSELAAIAIGGNVTYRPGARLVKITTDPKVYMVGADAMLYAIDSEATALNLFGSNWNTLIDDVPDAFFTNYSVASGDVSAAALGLGGALPVGTVVMFGGNYYFVGSSMHYKLSGDTSVYTSVVKPSDETEFQSWMGVASSAITTSMDAMSLVTPDRTGTTEGGDGGDEGGTADGLSASVKTAAEGGFFTVESVGGEASNVRTATVEVCSDDSVDVEEFQISIGGSGTAGFDNLIVWTQGPSGLIYEVNGTSNNNQTAHLTATDAEESVSGCEDFMFYVGSSNTGAFVGLVLDGVETSMGSADADGATLYSVPSVPIAAADLLDMSFGSQTAPSSVQSDGSLQRLYTIQSTVSNHDAYLENFVFKLNGSVNVDNCEYRRNGTVLSTDYDVLDDYYIFHIPEASRLFDEGSDINEVYCEVNGEAGQSFTPQLVFPAPWFMFKDSNRNEMVVTGNDNSTTSAATRISVSASSAITISGASATVENVTLENMSNGGTALDSKFTEGSTNQIVAAWKLKVRGSRGTLANLSFALDDATTNTRTLTGCQAKIGQRTDQSNFETSSIDLQDFSLSNYGSEQTLDEESDAVTLVTANKQLNVGDWLVVQECDFPTSLGNGDTLIVELDDAASANLTFDIGTTASVPASDVLGTTLNSYQLSSISTAAITTTRRLVSNATNAIIGQYKITGPLQEGVNVTSLGITFAAGIAGTEGCSSVNVAHSGTMLATSQNLTAAGTITFTTNFDVPQNEEYLVDVICVQAGTLEDENTATATTLATLSGSGLESAQSLSASPAQAGATVDENLSGTVVVTAGTNLPAQIVGPSEELKVLTINLAASSHEDQDLDTVSIRLDSASGAIPTDIGSVIVKAEGVTVAGVDAAAETTICTKSLSSSTAAADETVTCNFTTGQVRLAAGSTGTLTFYARGNTAGNIGTDTTPTDGTATFEFDVDESAQANNHVITKGVQSKALIFDGDTVGNTLEQYTGRALTPSAASVRIVKNSLPTTAISNPVNAVVALASMIVSGRDVSLLEFSGLCNTGVTQLCDDTNDDEVDLFVDNTLISGDVDVTAGAAAIFDLSTPVNVPVGTSELKVTFTDANGNCDQTGESLYFTTSEFGYSVISKDDATAQSFDTAGVGAFPVTVLADFNTYAGNIMTHQTIICG